MSLILQGCYCEVKKDCNEWFPNLDVRPIIGCKTINELILNVELLLL